MPAGRCHKRLGAQCSVSIGQKKVILVTVTQLLMPDLSRNFLGPRYIVILFEVSCAKSYSFVVAARRCRTALLKSIHIYELRHLGMSVLLEDGR